MLVCLTSSQPAARQSGLQGAKPLAIPAGLLVGASASALAGDSRQASRLEFVPFEPGHLASLRLQAAQAYLQSLIARPEYGAAMAGPHSWTGVSEGRLVGSAGILEQWPGRALCWALLGRDIRTRDFLRVHHKVTAVLQRVHREGTRRVETSVDAAFDAGHRWVRALGFAPEGLMRCYSPDGRDHVLYARIHDAARQSGLHGAKPLASPAIVNAVSRASAREEGALK